MNGLLYECGLQFAPRETLCEGYVVNAVPGASYESAKSRRREPLQPDTWRGHTGDARDSQLVGYEAERFS